MSTKTAARRFRVLIVDDNRVGADTLAMLLRLHGHDARAANDGEVALAMVGDWQPDAAVLDIVMSGLDGITLADRMRKVAARPMLIVAFTGLGSNDELAPVKAGAFDAVLLKPVDLDELLGMLDAHVPSIATIRGAAGASDETLTAAMTVLAVDRPIFGSPPSALACRKRRAAYAVILRGDGRVACACRPRGLWLPGGGILPGEGPEQAVKREIHEELGRPVLLTGRVGEAVQYFNSTADACWYEMTAYFFAGEFGPMAAGEQRPFWFDAGREAGAFFHASHAWAVSRAKGTPAPSAVLPGHVPQAGSASR
jgi:CheY-like chemotaxis protein